MQYQWFPSTPILLQYAQICSNPRFCVPTASPEFSRLNELPFPPPGISDYYTEAYSTYESGHLCANRVQMNPLENYLRELRDIRSSGAGVKESSYYAPLSNLLNEAGKSLKPKVRATLQFASVKAGKLNGIDFAAVGYNTASPAELKSRLWSIHA